MLSIVSSPASPVSYIQIMAKPLISSSIKSMTNLAGGKLNISDGGATPLHIAADNGSLELINCLLKSGADPNISDEERNISMNPFTFLVRFAFVFVSLPVFL
ncbi:unnamed protein product [Lupinus luteus]|uniref:Uncharacterized protein n=1 Tax=Lupinus luteus TaxID=3873 RepID=A0AAV1X2Z1_LUPLU